MGWSSLFLEMNKKKILIVGTGEVGKRRAERFLKEGAEVILIGNNISNELKEKGAIFNPKKNLISLVNWADIVIIASKDDKLNSYVSSISSEKLLNRADFPEKGNLIVPTSFYIENIQISIFTNGKSPLMARELRKKIQSSITNEDIINIKLQDYARNILKKNVPKQKDRKKFLYTLVKNEKIKKFINNNQLKEAKEYVDFLIKNQKS
ncbi:MAG: bifunctional precorrin-2 dehydrogenase/sirohydrochlorin ferrochelatase [Methanobacteriaceae archaeon]|jgi:precorrin-2 dehydrogenase/sirohydrochlorin ferrochelatase|nr:bifunctional precorrin-2 dehydrogenase/sirohydrochlorin ferrochelatase [Candidatus Methanorudis spinitermitis]